MRKKKVALHSNSSLANTGFGRSTKFLLSHLYKTGKYDLVEYAAGPLNWSHPICKSMPWKCFGVLPDNMREVDKFKDDPAKMMSVQYGEYNINKFLEQEKPDVLIMTEDIWGLPYLDKEWIGKFPHVFWTPIDSLPLLPVFKEKKDKFGNLWVKALFAKEALEKDGVKSEYIPDLIDPSEFRIFSEDERKENRRKYGIADDTLIFGFVFRNQLRKLVGTLIEGFAQFQKERPDIESKLFLHTFWAENDGWRIPEFATRFGVRREDILTTYVCRNCKHSSVKPYYGEEMPCSQCRCEKCVSTPNVTVGVTEEELCGLYNICDGYVHPATSGGFEMPILEAIFSGVPVAVTDYAFGKNFTAFPQVFPLKFFKYNEKGSQFDKAQVDPESVAEFMGIIADKSRKGRIALAKSVRDWAAREFDGTKICEWIEQFIDNLPFTDYDFNLSEKKDDKTFKIEDIINKNSGKKTILYVEPGSLGDCLNSTTVLRSLENKYPKEQWDYYVSTSYPNMFDHLPFITKILNYDPIFDDVLGMEGVENHKGYFDMAFHPQIARDHPDFFKNNF
jgi:glycosyltransferase involved in cell wall biosynthesis